MPLNSNAIQQPHTKKLIKWVVRILEVDQSIWLCRLSPNVHILAIYLQFDLLPNGSFKRFVEW
jgi:hypothetical protein